VVGLYTGGLIFGGLIVGGLRYIFLLIFQKLLSTWGGGVVNFLERVKIFGKH
jgi:hypothetical protein